jgi:hypothetical protein
MDFDLMWDPSWSLKRRPKSSHREQSLNTTKSKHPSENCIVMNSKYHTSFSLDTIWELMHIENLASIICTLKHVANKSCHFIQLELDGPWSWPKEIVTTLLLTQYANIMT